MKLRCAMAGHCALSVANHEESIKVIMMAIERAGYEPRARGGPMLSPPSCRSLLSIGETHDDA